MEYNIPGGLQRNVLEVSPAESIPALPAVILRIRLINLEQERFQIGVTKRLLSPVKVQFPQCGPKCRVPWSPASFTFLSTATRVITGHDDFYAGIGDLYASARIYTVEKIPAPLSGDQDLKAYLSKDSQNNITSHTNSDITIPDGISVPTVDFSPGSTTAMHRTVSIRRF